MLDRYLFFFFLFFVFQLPLPLGAARPFTWAAALIATLILSASWLAGFLFGKLQVSNAAKLASPVIGLLLLVMMWMGVQSVSEIAGMRLTFDTYATETQFLKTGTYVCVFVLTLLLVTSERKANLLAWTIIIGGTLQALIAIMINRTGTFINYNHLAGYLEMSLAVGIGLMVSHLSANRSVNWRQLARRWISTLLGPKVRVRMMLVIMVIGLIVSRSRMGNTAFFASMGIAGLIGLLLFRHNNRSVLLLLASLIIVDFFLMGAFFGIDELQKRFEQVNVAADARALVRDSTKMMIADFPISGVGAGSYYTAFPHYRSVDNPQFYLHAHNDFLEFQSELGFIGTLPLFVVLIWSLAISVRAQQKRRSTFMKSMGFSATMAITAILIHSTSDFNLQITANAMTFMVILAFPYIALTLKSQQNVTRG